jgi:dipeptidyl aminopeptidase/acylaminoacyl peptidase
MSAERAHPGGPSGPSPESGPGPAGPGQPGGRQGRRSWRVVAASVATVLAIVLGGGYLAVGASIYDSLSRVEPGCGGVAANQDPARFTVSELDATPYLMPRFEDVAFPSRDAALTIRAFWIPSDAGPDAPAVIVVHGLNGCRRSEGNLLAAGMLHRNGFAALVVDLRNHGDSSREDGRYSGGIKEYRDVLGAWDWLVTRQGLEPARIGLMGLSLGAATALIATGQEPRVAAVWEDSSYADLDAAIRGELTRDGDPTWFAPGGVLMARIVGGVDLTSLSPIEAVAGLNGRPIFIAHGTEDERLSVRYAYDLAGEIATHGGLAEMWIVPGSKHTMAIRNHPVEYERRLADFFRRALGSP